MKRLRFVIFLDFFTAPTPTGKLNKETDRCKDIEGRNLHNIHDEGSEIFFWWYNLGHCTNIYVILKIGPLSLPFVILFKKIGFLNKKGVVI